MANFDTYGLLYNRFAVVDARNLSATGWRVPSTDDTYTLYAYLSTNRGGKLKETGITYWNTPNTGAVNSVGFNGRGAGQRSALGIFGDLKSYMFFWTATAYEANGLATILSYTDADFNHGAIFDPIVGLSVRLIKTTTTLEHGQFGTYTGNDGREYETVCIGTQEWLASNLRETEYRNGDHITVITNTVEWSELTDGAVCAYDNDGYTESAPDPETPLNYATRFIIPFISGMDKEYSALIKEIDYTGSSTQITGDAIPGERELKGEGDVLEDKILRSSFKLSLMCENEGDYRDLFTNNWKKYIIEIYKDTFLYWVGFLTTDYYQEPWTSPPYAVTVTAHDGLGQLKMIDFVNTLDEPFTGKITLAEIIGQCLYKILPFTVLYEGINIIEEHQASGVSFLNHVALQAERFYMNGTMKCHDVLHEVMKICNAQIFQQDSIWWIVSIGNRSDSFARNRMGITATYTDSLLSTSWAVLGTDTYNPIETIDGLSEGIVWWETPQMTKLPAWKQFTIHQDLGLKESMFIPTSFIEINTPDYEVFQDGDTVPFSYFNSSRRGDFTFDEYTVVYRNEMSGSLRFNLGYFDAHRDQQLKIDLDFNKKVRILQDIEASFISIRLILIAGATTYYVHRNPDSTHGVWLTSAASIFTVGVFDYKLQTELTTSVITDELPTGGFLFIDIIPLNDIPPAPLAVLINATSIRLTMSGFSIPISIDAITNIDPDQNYIPDQQEMMFGDFIDVDNNVRMYAGGLWYVAGVGSYGVTTDWHTSQSAVEKPLINLIADEIGAIHAYTTWMLSGQLRGNIKPVSALYDPYAGRRMIMKRFIENCRDDEWDVDLIQVSQDAMILVTYTSDEIVTDTGDNIGA